MLFHEEYCLCLLIAILWDSSVDASIGQSPPECECPQEEAKGEIIFDFYSPSFEMNLWSGRKSTYTGCDFFLPIRSKKVSNQKPTFSKIVDDIFITLSSSLFIFIGTQSEL